MDIFDEMDMQESIDNYNMTHRYIQVESEDYSDLFDLDFDIKNVPANTQIQRKTA